MPFVTKHGVFEQYKDFFLKNSETDYRSQPIFSKIASLFKEDFAHSSLETVYEFSQVSLVNAELVPHIDARKCVISIPLVPISSVYWYRDKTNSGSRTIRNLNDCEIIDQYDYRYPVTLVNTEVYHGVPDNNSPRIFFQVGGFMQSIQEVVIHLK
jgi:hypothetical protein